MDNTQQISTTIQSSGNGTLKLLVGALIGATVAGVTAFLLLSGGRDGETETANGKASNDTAPQATLAPNTSAQQYYTKEIDGMYEVDLGNGYKTLVPKGHIAAQTMYPSIAIIDTSYYSDDYIANLQKIDDVYIWPEFLDENYEKSVKAVIYDIYITQVLTDSTPVQEINDSILGELLQLNANQCSDYSGYTTEKNDDGVIIYFENERETNLICAIEGDSQDRDNNHRFNDRNVAVSTATIAEAYSMLAFTAVDNYEVGNEYEGLSMDTLRKMAQHLVDTKYDGYEDAIDFDTE